MPPITPAGMPYSMNIQHPTNLQPVNLPYPPPPEFYRPLRGAAAEQPPTGAPGGGPESGAEPRGDATR
jgi:hypothetical protein